MSDQLCTGILHESLSQILFAAGLINLKIWARRWEIWGSVLFYHALLLSTLC